MTNYILTNDGELKHYGVIGMKWGQRKAQKAGTSYTYKSHGQKKWEKKLAEIKAETHIKRRKGESLDKAQKRALKRYDKATAKLGFYMQRDENRQKYAESTTAGKSVARGLLLGPFGTGNYNRLRAAGMGRVSSAVLSYLGGYPVSRLVESSTARRDIEREYGPKRK